MELMKDLPQKRRVFAENPQRKDKNSAFLCGNSLRLCGEKITTTTWVN